MTAPEPALPRLGRPRRFGEVEERERLLKAGFEVIRSKGYSDATVADILAEADVSTRSFYRHFQSKEELVSSIFERDAERFSAAVSRRVEAAGSPWDAVTSWVDEILEFGRPRPRTRRAAVLGAPAVRRALPPRQMRKALELLLVPLEEAIRSGTAQGVFSTDRAEVVSDLISAMAWETSARIADAVSPEERDDLRAALVAFVARGLGHRDAAD